MDKLFESVINDTATTGQFFLCIGIALLSGALFAFLCKIKTRQTNSFSVAIALLPAVVAMVIMLVNGNVGTGVAIAGAFSLVRFRSAQGTAREICIIFVAMASGLAFGMGYLAYGIVFLLVIGGALAIYEVVKNKHNTENLEKTLTITIPEDLDYTGVFENCFNTYTEKNQLVKVKTTNMGSMFRLTYDVTMKKDADEKSFIDELRTKNANLEITLAKTVTDANTL